MARHRTHNKRLRYRAAITLRSFENMGLFWKCTGFLSLYWFVASPVVVDGFSTTASNHPQQQRKNQQYPSSVLATVIVNGDDATTGTSKDDFVKEEESSPPPEETKTTAVPHLEIYQDDDDATMFDIVAQRAAACLFESELRRDQRGDNNQGSSNNNNNNNMLTSSATNNNVWINDAAAFALQSTLNKIKIKLPEERTGLDRDESSAWIRWMKSAPTPLIVDLSNELRAVANATISDAQFDLIRHHVGGGDGRTKFMERLGCRIVLFPSGASLSAPLREPPASFIYGKLMYGGVTRYRQLISSSSKRGPPRKAGERTDVKVSASDNIPAWIQYGGTERMYEAVDMGPTAVLEVLLLPAGQSLSGSSSSSSSSSNNDNDDDDGDMVIQNLLWKPQQMFDMVNDDISSIEESIDYVTGYSPISQSGKDRNDAFESDFKSSVGGLQKEIDAIVRRVLDGRVIRPVQEGDNIATTTVETTATQDETTTALAAAAMEAEELAVLGLTPVRGLLLYGPPGTGKTLLARQIARALRARTPKIVSAPELLDRWVGGSEKLVRMLFSEAEAELAACDGDATKSALHVVVIDEIDAVFRRRSSGEDSGEATRASVVNQILAKLDGINAIDNVLMIGMTNRRELLDEALLRPGRLEVQIEIPLPDQEGRREIMQIHFDALRKKGRLSQPLCCAIDGVPYGKLPSRADNSLPEDVDVDSASSSNMVVARIRKRDKFKRTIEKVWYETSSAIRPAYDLAATSATGGFSGADIAGLVRCAGSLALSRARKDGNGVGGLLITLEDVKQALDEVRP